MIIRLLLLMFIFMLVFPYMMILAPIVIPLWFFGRRYYLRKLEDQYNQRLNGKINQYGVPERIIRYDDKFMLIYTERQKLFLEGNFLSWSSITGVRQATTHDIREVDNSNMLKRSFWGWLLFGDLGAVTGGVTGRTVPQSYNQNKGRYHYILQTNNMDHPNIHFLVLDLQTKEEMISCINIMMREAASSCR